MNNPRRKELAAISSRIEELKSDLENIRDDEQESFDNMPESLQGSDRGQASENAISHLGDVICSLEEAISGIESASE